MKIVLIIGCARSGTSILGELLAAHSEIHYLFEQHSLWEIAKQRPDKSHVLGAQDATPDVTKRILSFFDSELNASEKSLVVEKCPRNSLRIPYLRAIFPDVKFIHIVRDGRDVACSLRAGLQPSWNHLRPPKWRAYTEEPLINRCAKVWRDVVYFARSHLKKTPHLEIKYEDLVRSPFVVARSICQWLEIEPDENMIEFTKKIQNRTRDSYHASIQIRWYREDHDWRIGRWKENLNKVDREIVNKIQQPLLKRLGYLS